MTVANRQFTRLSALARAFGIVALLAPVLWSRDQPALYALMAIGAIWTGAQLVEMRTRISPISSAVVEGALVGAVCGFSIHTSLAVIGALALPPFTAGLRSGWRGATFALCAQLVSVVIIAFTLFGELSAEQSFGAFTWCVTGLGLGLIAGFVHSTIRQSPNPLGPYLYAQSLIRELIGLSGGLSSGLDPVALGGVILSAVRDDLPTVGLVMYVPRGDTLTPLITEATPDAFDLSACDDLALESWALSRPMTSGRVFALPLLTEAGTTAVVAGLLSDRLDLGRLGLEERLQALLVHLEVGAVHLDTALLFAAFRDSATAEERRRLAREMHDGVAQDIASLGYLVDALAAQPTSPEQAERIQDLRKRVTAVVAEVRRSVVTLRTSVGASESLGTAIGSIARNLTEVSGVPIHVTLDELTTRLRSEVEAELFRIAQEAMTNAVRHARAKNIRVHCQVHAPAAVITVSDDGQGMQRGRPDSHGLAIMRERALLIDAELSIGTNRAGGTTVTVRTPGAPGGMPPTSGSSAIVKV
ncbi:sensor histidine kinase [Nocardioides sp.]|uniref:sensor histidine kinase n=1 Tax=Nocardioides sp. TaxID=35761 RepID=UPI00356B19D3